MTPFLTAKLAGQYVAVDAAGLFMSTLQVRFMYNGIFMIMHFIYYNNASFDDNRGSCKINGPYWFLIFMGGKFFLWFVPLNIYNVLIGIGLCFQVVLLPVLAGAFLNQYFRSFVKIVCPVMPPIAVATVAILCGNAIAQSSSAILMSGQQAAVAVALLHTSGFFFGYVLSRLLGIDVSSSRTISIEVGMQVKLIFLKGSNTRVSLEYVALSKF